MLNGAKKSDSHGLKVRVASLQSLDTGSVSQTSKINLGSEDEKATLAPPLLPPLQKASNPPFSIRAAQ